MSREPTQPTSAPVAANAPSAGRARDYWRGWAMLCRAFAEMERERGRGRAAAGLHLQANHYQRQAGAARASESKLADSV